MLKTELLNYKNFNALKVLERETRKFNPLNKSFSSEYTNLNLFQKFFSKKKVRLLKHLNEYKGFLWYEYTGINSVNIEALYINNSAFFEKGFTKLVNDSLNHSVKQISYLCKENEFAISTLLAAGYRKLDGTQLMSKNLEDFVYCNDNKLIFKTLERNSDEKIRLRIQNEVFKSDTRLPLRIEDIYFDEEQEYYFDGGAIFLLSEGEYVGYGQVIIEENNPYIVNIGILDKFRNQGYGKKLLQYLLSIAKEKGYSKAYLKVNLQNKIALKLYESLGFKNEYIYFNYIKRR